MGKAEITTNLGNGQYTIDLLRDLTKLQAEIGRINNEINKLTSISIPEAQTNLSHSESVEKIAQSNLSNAIASGAENLLSFITIHRKAIAEVDSNTSTLGILEAKSISLQKRLDLLNTETLGPAQNAWCTDLTPDLSGEVATIEVPGERSQVFIRPGYTDNAVHSPARDGQLQPVYSNTSSAAFFNAALLPGWQKWNPQYRTGTITFISEDKSTCSVSLDAEQSTAQNLGVNKETALTGVTFSYMSCDGQAFSIGDSVVIEFPNRDWDTARVIGFTDSPKACSLKIKVTRDDGTIITDAHSIAFWVRNSSATWLTVTPSYDAVSQYWTLAITEDFPEDGVEVFFDCADSVWTKYPYKYKSDDYDPVNSLIQLGSYEAALPYWVVGGVYLDPARIYMNPCNPCITNVGDAFITYWLDGAIRHFRHIIVDHFDSAFAMKSSIPYRLGFNLQVERAYSSYSQSGCHFCWPCGYTIKSNCGDIDVEWGLTGGSESKYGSIIFPGAIGGTVHKYTIQNTFVECFLGKTEINLCLDSANFGMWPNYDF